MMDFTHENSSLRLKRLCARLQSTTLLLEEALQDFSSVDNLSFLQRPTLNVEINELVQGSQRICGRRQPPSTTSCVDRRTAVAPQSASLGPTFLLLRENPRWSSSQMLSTRHCQDSSNQEPALPMTPLASAALGLSSSKQLQELRQISSLREMILMSSYLGGHFASSQKPSNIIPSHHAASFSQQPFQFQSLVSRASELDDNSVAVALLHREPPCDVSLLSSKQLLKSGEITCANQTECRYDHARGMPTSHDTIQDGTHAQLPETMLAAMILSAGSGLKSQDESIIQAVPPRTRKPFQYFLSEQIEDAAGGDLVRKAGSVPRLCSIQRSLSLGDIKNILQQLGRSLRRPEDPYVDVSDIATEIQLERCARGNGKRDNSDASDNSPYRCGREASESFVEKLHMMLTEMKQEGESNVASFLPHGRAFAIHDVDRFVSDFLPKYFKQSKWSSFQRQLNLYGFLRLQNGPDKGGYYHELFLDGRPQLCSHMRRVGVPVIGGVDRRKIKIRRNQMNDPDFYSMKPLNA